MKSGGIILGRGRIRIVSRMLDADQVFLFLTFKYIVRAMVLILDGNSDRDTDARSVFFFPQGFLYSGAEIPKNGLESQKYHYRGSPET